MGNYTFVHYKLSLHILSFMKIIFKWRPCWEAVLPIFEQPNTITIPKKCICINMRTFWQKESELPTPPPRPPPPSSRALVIRSLKKRLPFTKTRFQVRTNDLREKREGEGVNSSVFFKSRKLVFPLKMGEKKFIDNFQLLLLCSTFKLYVDEDEDNVWQISFVYKMGFRERIIYISLFIYLSKNFGEVTNKYMTITKIMESILL